MFHVMLCKVPEPSFCHAQGCWGMEMTDVSPVHPSLSPFPPARQLWGSSRSPGVPPSAQAVLGDLTCSPRGAGRWLGRCVGLPGLCWAQAETRGGTLDCHPRWLVESQELLQESPAAKPWGRTWGRQCWWWGCDGCWAHQPFSCCKGHVPELTQTSSSSSSKVLLQECCQTSIQLCIFYHCMNSRYSPSTSHRTFPHSCTECRVFLVCQSWHHSWGHDTMCCRRGPTGQAPKRAQFWCLSQPLELDRPPGTSCGHWALLRAPCSPCPALAPSAVPWGPSASTDPSPHPDPQWCSPAPAWPARCGSQDQSFSSCPPRPDPALQGAQGLRAAAPWGAERCFSFSALCKYRHCNCAQPLPATGYVSLGFSRANTAPEIIFYEIIISEIRDVNNIFCETDVPFPLCFQQKPNTSH